MDEKGKEQHENAYVFELWRNCRQHFKFYEQHLGGKITMICPTVNGGLNSVSADLSKTILHARMTIGECATSWKRRPAGAIQPMRSVYLSLLVGSIEEPKKFMHCFPMTAKFLCPCRNFFCVSLQLLRDRFGTSWMILQERPSPQRN